jgi:hypothetical protein
MDEKRDEPCKHGLTVKTCSYCSGALKKPSLSGVTPGCDGFMVTAEHSRIRVKAALYAAWGSRRTDG